MKTAAKLLSAGAAAWVATQAYRVWTRYTFTGKSVLITGGSRGLGLEISRRLADEGAHLTLLARNEQELRNAELELRGHGASVLSIPCDIRQREQVNAAIEQSVLHFGRLDMLVNDAGIIQVGPIDDMTLSDFEEALAVHLWGPLYTILAALPHMRRQGSGRIVNIASIGGKVGLPHLAPYCASKFALVGLSDSLRAELYKDNIYVTTVCPGLMRTGSHENAMFKGQNDKEFAWFAIGNALPGASIASRRAARRIVEAARHGRAFSAVSFQSRALILGNALFPELAGRVSALVNELLPEAGGIGAAAKSGWESHSKWAPSLATRLSDKQVSLNNELVTSGG